MPHESPPVDWSYVKFSNVFSCCSVNQRGWHLLQNRHASGDWAGQCASRPWLNLYFSIGFPILEDQTPPSQSVSWAWRFTVPWCLISVLGGEPFWKWAIPLGQGRLKSPPWGGLHKSPKVLYLRLYSWCPLRGSLGHSTVWKPTAVGTSQAHTHLDPLLGLSFCKKHKYHLLLKWLIKAQQ